MTKKTLISLYIALCASAVGGYALASYNGWYPFLSSDNKSTKERAGARGGHGGGMVFIHK